MTTQSSEAREEAADRAVASPGADRESHRAGARAGAYSLPSVLPSALSPVTESDPATRAREAVLRLAATRTWFLARIERAKARELNLVHGPPPTIAAMHARHAQAAAHWQGGFPKGCRLAWGWLHTAVFTLVLAGLDAAFSPAGAVIAVLFIYALLHWL